MSGAIDRYGQLVSDPLDGTGVQLGNKPLLGVIAVGAGTTNLDVSIDGGTTWFPMDPVVPIVADVAMSSSDLAPLAAYCIGPVLVRFTGGVYTSVTAVTWICSG